MLRVAPEHNARRISAGNLRQFQHPPLQDFGILPEWKLPCCLSVSPTVGDSLCFNLLRSDVFLCIQNGARLIKRHS
jgi:hypothetical protein